MQQSNIEGPLSSNLIDTVAKLRIGTCAQSSDSNSAVKNNLVSNPSGIDSGALKPASEASAHGEASKLVAAPIILVTNANQRKIVILRLKEVQARIGLGRSAIYYLMDQSDLHHDPTFPKSIKISTHAIGWVESEIDAWLDARIAASRS